MNKGIIASVKIIAAWIVWKLGELLEHFLYRERRFKSYGYNGVFEHHRRRRVLSHKEQYGQAPKRL